MNMLSLLNKNGSDEYYTPYYAIDPLISFLPKNKIIWECTDFGDSQITKCLIDNGFKVISTHISNFDFLCDIPNFDFDIIITNPPYSKKDLFLKKCYEYNKPFALLLPLTCLEGKKRHLLFNKYGLQLLIFDGRINFLNVSHKINCWFNSSWFCFNLLPKDIIFYNLKKNDGLDYSISFYENDSFNLFNF